MSLYQREDFQPVAEHPDGQRDQEGTRLKRWETKPYWPHRPSETAAPPHYHQAERDYRRREHLYYCSEWNRLIKHCTYIDNGDLHFIFFILTIWSRHQMYCKTVLLLVLQEDFRAVRFRFFPKKCVPKGASLAAVLAGAVEMKDRRAHKATMPTCAPSAHWEGVGHKAQSLTTAKLERWH